MSRQIDTVKKYISLVESFDFDASTTEGLLHPEYLQWELPNQLNKNGQKSDAADSFKRMKTACQILTAQKYEITNVLESGANVVIETVWSATMAIDAGPLKKGQAMKAFFCMFFEFEGGQIRRVRNYDCFEPLA